MSYPLQPMPNVGIRAHGTELWCYLPVAAYLLPRYVCDTSARTMTPDMREQPIEWHAEATLTGRRDDLEAWLPQVVDLLFDPILLDGLLDWNYDEVGQPQTIVQAVAAATSHAVDGVTHVMFKGANLLVDSGKPS